MLAQLAFFNRQCARERMRENPAESFEIQLRRTTKLLSSLRLPRVVYMLTHARKHTRTHTHNQVPGYSVGDAAWNREREYGQRETSFGCPIQLFNLSAFAVYTHTHTRSYTQIHADTRRYTHAHTLSLSGGGDALSRKVPLAAGGAEQAKGHSCI